MNISTGVLSQYWIWGSAVVYAIALIFIIRRVPWGIIMRERGIQHLLFGSAVILVLLWQLRAGVTDYLTIYFLGITTLTLMFGWDLAVLVGSIVMLVMTLLGIETWQMLPINLVCNILIPAGVSILILRLVEAKLPKNFFIYMFLCAFAGAGVAVGVSGFSMAMILWLDGIYPWYKIYHDYAQYLPLIMVPEGLINGIIMTGMMVFHPDWIRTFDAKAYIDDQ
ncbi:energy-coupling factor ABC transporter permease [Nitrincola schmidtii]|uniref:energy-coupling factor ABC transporter permease n=1 Tax=Nitrincola schmidtii TaxID=1730894 RepID=UPI00124D5D76|nr:energy-coupling factor ABC transporter permease [Nitrincola schmidtii]